MRFLVICHIVLTIALGLLCNGCGSAAQENWQTTTMWEAGVKLERVIIGDVDGDHKRNEVLVLSQDGRVVLITGTATRWDSKVLWKHTGKLFGAAIGDLDKEHKGNEVFVGGDGGTVEMIYPDSLQHKNKVT